MMARDSLLPTTLVLVYTMCYLIPDKTQIVFHDKSFTARMKINYTTADKYKGMSYSPSSESSNYYGLMKNNNAKGKTENCAIRIASSTMAYTTSNIEALSKGVSTTAAEEVVQVIHDDGDKKAPTLVRLPFLQNVLGVQATFATNMSLNISYTPPPQLRCLTRSVRSAGFPRSIARGNGRSHTTPTDLGKRKQREEMYIPDGDGDNALSFAVISAGDGFSDVRYMPPLSTHNHRFEAPSYNLMHFIVREHMQETPTEAQQDKKDMDLVKAAATQIHAVNAILTSVAGVKKSNIHDSVHATTLDSMTALEKAKIAETKAAMFDYFK